jgi:hypothetical protein
VHIFFINEKSDPFQGFNKFTWLLVFLSAFGGLVLAVAVKFTDSLMKVRLETNHSTCLEFPFSSDALHFRISPPPSLCFLLV